MSLLYSYNNVYAADNRKSTIRTFGDYAQVINPIFVGVIESQEKGFGHFAFIYGQTWVAMHSMKLIGHATKSKWSKRPYIKGKKDRYDGMPSGHTASAWAAASYIRIFSQDYKFLAAPLYVTAAITGYSRIKAKEHTAGQVVAGAILAESITYINSKLAWSKNYQFTDLYLGKDEYAISFKFKF